MPFEWKKLLFLYTFIYSINVAAYAQDYRVSLLTCDEGEELYTAFGHSAIRVTDLQTGQDLVYNYGTFDFNEPFFYIKFIQRTLDYNLSVSSFENFVYYYTYFERNMREQVLDLNPEQTRRFVQFLQINYLPQNRAYRYDFFYDNCATRIRDGLENVLGKQLDWNETPNLPKKTFRNLIDEYVYYLPWSDFGIDLALGAAIDVYASEREKQFLPDYMETAFAGALIVGDGPTRPLVSERSTILEFPPLRTQMDLFNPYIFWWIFALGVIILTFVGHQKKRLYKEFDIALFIALGLLGLLLFFLWFVTFHSQTKYNWNILWASPTHLVLAWGLSSKTIKPWVKKYLLFVLIATNLAIVFGLVGWQSFHPSITPVLIVILLRSTFLYYNIDKQSRKKKRIL